jgi:phosphate transport system substrate-binding protein
MKRIQLALAVCGIAALCVLSGCHSRGTDTNNQDAGKAGAPPALQLKNKLNFSNIPKRADGARLLQGSGGTFPELLYGKWFPAYSQGVGVEVQYDFVGSAVGLQRLTKGTVDFGGIDVALTDEQLKALAEPVVHVPTALGAVAIAYNIPELQNSDVVLKLTPENVAGIFSGEITKWNDPSLVANNPVLQSVEQSIITIHRSDSSGTSYVFSDYLSAVDQRWQKKIGNGTAVTWPVGLGVELDLGVAQEVKANEYSIGYTGSAVAVQHSLLVASVRNLAGNFVAPSSEGITAAAEAAQVPDDLRFTLINSTGKMAYPICTATWIVVPKDIKDARKALSTCDLLWWITHEGQVANADLRFAPLTPAMVTKAEALVRGLTSNKTQTQFGK